MHLCTQQAAWKAACSLAHRLAAAEVTLKHATQRKKEREITRQNTRQIGCMARVSVFGVKHAWSDLIWPKHTFHLKAVWELARDQGEVNFVDHLRQKNGLKKRIVRFQGFLDSIWESIGMCRKVGFVKCFFCRKSKTAPWSKAICIISKSKNSMAEWGCTATLFSKNQIFGLKMSRSLAPAQPPADEWTDVCT